jgi:hypothetical protein
VLIRERGEVRKMDFLLIRLFDCGIERIESLYLICE